MGPRGLSLALVALSFPLLLLAGPPARGSDVLVVGSKRFTESYILGEILAQAAHARHKAGLGNTAILLEALETRAVDVYPEYTGTIEREILKTDERLDVPALNERLARLGLAVSDPLGFSDSYALGMRGEQAKRLGIATISDLKRHPELRLGFSHEFLGRRDGWPGLQAAYGLPFASPRGLDHGLAYEALAAGEVDVIDLYTTDAKIDRYGVAVLKDDRGFFPPYEAVLLHRLDAPQRFPEAFARFGQLAGTIDAATMRKLNARAEIDKLPFAEIAADFLHGRGGAGRAGGLAGALFAPDFGRLALEHVGLVFGSLLAAIAVGVPLGLVAARSRLLAQLVLATTGLLQTIPSLAMLAFLIPLTGRIGAWPALIALFLYALLPIARNTHAGVSQVPAGLLQAGTALGLSSRELLIRIKLPLSLPTIMAGVKTSAVINVGTATIAAFIGAGGFGERIAQGLALNDHDVLLAGALPAAALALGVHALFEWIERSLVRAPR